jgi:hypothetical protein
MIKGRTGLLSILVLALASTLMGSVAEADPGVGVNLGRIEINDRLAPGGSYNLPALGVLNTGSDPGDYEVVITYLGDQAQKRPPAGWFSLQPQRFYLEAKQAESVNIRLTLPTGADPGDYFAYIEAHPINESQGVRISIAAATKLSFTVKPSNWFDAQRVQLNRYIDDNQPWSYLIPGAALAALLLLTLRRFFRLRLQLERR